MKAGAKSSSWRWRNSKARPKGNGSLELPLTLDPTCLDSYTTTKNEKEINERWWVGRKGLVCVWKSHLFCNQDSWKGLRARITCVFLPLAECNTWYILPPAQWESCRGENTSPAKTNTPLKRRMKRRPAFYIILVIFNTILLRPWILSRPESMWQWEVWWELIWQDIKQQKR